MLPNVSCSPTSTATSGAEAVELAAAVGLELDDWQKHVLDVALGETPAGNWSAFEVGLVVSRQNGKSEILVARMLAGMFLLRERLIVYSAHEFKAAREIFYRFKALVENSPTLMGRVERITTGAGNEGVELKTGERVRFVARTGSSGRGFTGDCVILDEAFNLPYEAHASLMPTLSARPNPQMWYASSAVDQLVHPNGVTLGRLRERATSEDPGSLAWLEWSVSPDEFWDDPKAGVKNREFWERANPALDIRISRDHVEKESDAMPPRAFAMERLSVGNWPLAADEESDEFPITKKDWDALEDLRSQIVGPITLGVAVTNDRSRSCIAAAGFRADGASHIEVIDHQHGVKWLTDRITQLVERHAVTAVVVDAYANVEDRMPDLPVSLTITSASDLAASTARFVDSVIEGTVRHLGQTSLNLALEAAQTKPLAGGFKWKPARGADITPLDAVTAAHGALTSPDAPAAPAPFVAYG